MAVLVMKMRIIAGNRHANEGIAGCSDENGSLAIYSHANENMAGCSHATENYIRF
jgi:hypothetical protein